MYMEQSVKKYRYLGKTRKKKILKTKLIEIKEDIIKNENNNI